MLRSISDHVMDIAQNSVKAGAENVELIIDESEDTFKFVVKDDGNGMTEEELSEVFDPFYTTRDHRIRKVGLGLPFLKQITELTGGYTKIESEKGKGTRVEAVFNLKSVDCPPVGDLVGTLTSLITGCDNVRWIIRRLKNGEEIYNLDSKVLRDKYGDLLSSPSFIKVLEDSLRELESLGEIGDEDQGQESP